MQEQLNLLKEVQGIETQIVAVRTTHQKYSDELAALEAEKSQYQVMSDSLADELAGLDSEKRELEIELQKEQDRIAQVEGRLPQIKTQKEYVAVLKEIDAAKKDNRDIEEAVALKDEAISALQAEKAEKDEKLDALASALTTRSDELAEEMGQLSSSLDEQTASRDKLLQELPIQLRKRYLTLVSRRQGLAVVAAKEGACQGCHMHLPPQMFNNLYRMTSIQHCPHCNRILYMDDQP